MGLPTNDESPTRLLAVPLNLHNNHPQVSFHIRSNVLVLLSLPSPPSTTHFFPLTLAPFSASSTLGRIVPAYLADRLGRFNSIFIITLFNAVVLLAFWLPIEVSHHTTHTEVFALSALAGFSTGACIGLFMPCAAELGPVETLGSRFGLYQTVIGLG